MTIDPRNTRRSLALAALLLTAAAPPELARVRSVTDGDTFRLHNGERIRIAGIDAPETDPRRARCRAELTLGKAATARARAMLEGRAIMLTRVGRSYDRTVASATLDGRDLGAQLVAAGVARPWPRFAVKPDWCVGAADRRPAPRSGGRRG